MIRVNGETIDPSLVEEAFHRIKSEAEARSEASCCERDEEFHKQAEEEVIEGTLLAQEAERQIPEPKADDIRDAFEEYIRKFRDNGASWDMIESQRDQLRQEVIAKIRMKRFTEKIWRKLPEIDDEAYEQWYEAHPERFHVHARAKVRHLVRNPGEDPDAEYRKLVDIRNKVLEGADFKELAKEHTSRADGNTDLGWIEHKRTLHPIESMIFSLRKDEISPVFYFDQSLHLVCIEELEPAQTKPYKEVAEEVKELAKASQRRKALKSFAKELEKRGKIERTSLKDKEPKEESKEEPDTEKAEA